MKRAAALRQVVDWSDFVRGHCLRELLDQHGPGETPSRIVASPDRQHLLLLWNQPASQARVVAFQRLGTSGADLERSWQPPQPPVVGLLFLESAAAAFWVLTIVWEQGRTELWRFVPATGWCLLQSLELCCGVRARIISICSWGSRLVWCEERPPLNTQLTPEKKAFRYCICTRDLQISENGAQLSPLRIVLHNSPVYEVLASPSGVFLVPTPATFSGVGNCVLIWRPRNADIVVAAPSRGCVCTKTLHAGCEMDFKKLVLRYVGILASLETLDIHSCSISNSKGLFLITSLGNVDLVQPNGMWRPVFDFGERVLIPREEAQLKVFRDTLACLLGGILYLVDLNSRQLLEKKLLSTEMFFLDFHVEEEEAAVQFLSPNGIYHLDFSGTDKDSQPEPALVEMVFEEACKYYQRRSLSSSQLTVEKLKKGGMFQAPIVLSSILCHSLASKDKRTGVLPEPYAKLWGTMQLELQSYQNLEFLKSCVIGTSESEVDRYGEELVEQELSRLLRLDLNRENLAYLNAIFSSFPVASWKAIQNHLQLQQNGDGLLVARATSEVWKKILRGAVPTSCKQEVSLNGVLPLFELICLSLHQFKPKWLPQFVELSQQYVGTSWAYNKEGPEGGVPLYKRALAVLTRKSNCFVASAEMEIELLLCSHRPKAILQAMDLLIRHRKWQRVMDVAEKFSKLSPLLNKEIFIILLEEFAQHRALDPYLDMLWELCPVDLSAFDVLSIIQQHLPQTEFDHPPFLPDGTPQLTFGLLKPLLHQLACCSSGQDKICADVLQGPAFPPPTPPRDHQPVAPKAATQENAKIDLLPTHTQGTWFEGV